MWLNIKVCVFFGLVVCVIDDTESFDWDLNHVSSIVQSHSQSLRIIQEGLRRTDHVWDWFLSNKEQISDIIREKQRHEKDDVTGKSELQDLVREIQTNFSEALNRLSREMTGELNMKEVLRETNLPNEELNRLKLDIKLINETFTNTVSKVFEYSRRIVSNSNETIENGISEISKMRLEIHGVISALGNAEKKINSLENRLHLAEKRLYDNPNWNDTTEEETSSISNVMERLLRRNLMLQRNIAEINSQIGILTSQVSSMNISEEFLSREMYKGEPGVPGPKGETGSLGLKGEKGNMGPGGLPGIGQKGDKGSMGPGGLTGIGQKGDKGSMGPGGLTGIGQKGDKGSFGLVGLPGIDQKGDKDSMGPGGLTGIGQKGDKGSVGLVGLPGIGQKEEQGSGS